jgi:hypothetical protein
MLTKHSAPTHLFSMGTKSAEVQVVANGPNGIIIDAQTVEHDVAGHKRHAHTTIRLSIDDAIRYEIIIGDAISIALEAWQDDPRQTRLWAPAVTPDTRQTAIWSDATLRAVGERFVA